MPVPEPRLVDEALELRPGDRRLLYTDGAIDAKRGDERLGRDRLLEVVAAALAGSAYDLADIVDRAFLDFNVGALPDDAALEALAAAS